MSDQTDAPESLVEAYVWANMAGVTHGDVVWVDPDDPEIQDLLNADPPLLELVDSPVARQAPRTPQGPL